MRRAAAVALLFLAAACASAPPKAEIHPEFAALRPAMLVLEVDAPEDLAEDLRSTVNRALIEKNYSPLAPGARKTPDAGTFEVTFEPEGAEAVFRDPVGTALYRRILTDPPEDPEDLAEALLEALPRK